MNSVHTCGECWKSAHPKKNWLVGIIKDRLRDSPNHKPKDIANGLLRDFGLELNYSQVWRSIEDAKEQLQGSYKDSYNLLPWYCEKAVEANPGSIVKLSTTDSKFQRLFVSFSASIHGFQTCRPLLFLDAIPLKSKYHESLLTATGLDGNDDLFPVAYAVVDIENDDNWHWLLEQLRSAVATSRSITFVFDRDKGLRKAVLEVFENPHIGYSLNHLLTSFKENLRGPFHGDGRASLAGSFLAAAYAVRLETFKMYTEQIRRVSSKAYDWIMQIEPEHWTNAAFKGEYYNHINVNVVEMYASWIEEARELPIMQKLETLGCKMKDLMNIRRADSSKWSTKLTPSKEEKLKEEYAKARGLKVLFSSDTLFEVHDDSINVVDTDKCVCSCMAWKVNGIPCAHALAVFHCTDKNGYDYCSKYFTVDSFSLAYLESIATVLASFKPLDKEKAVTETDPVVPPCTPRPPNQQKKQRYKPVGEVKREICCSRCKGIGHNKATCKEPLLPL